MSHEPTHFIGGVCICCCDACEDPEHPGYPCICKDCPVRQEVGGNQWVCEHGDPRPTPGCGHSCPPPGPCRCGDYFCPDDTAGADEGPPVTPTVTVSGTPRSVFHDDVAEDVRAGHLVAVPATGTWFVTEGKVFAMPDIPTHPTGSDDE